MEYLKQNRTELNFNLDEVLGTVHNHGHAGGGCPGSRERVINKPAAASAVNENAKSELRHWPVQMHLINPNASYFQGADLLVAADCVAYSTGAFHSRFLKGKSLAIACPKLDHNTEIYIDKLTTTD